METPPYTIPALPNYFISSLAQTLNAGGGDTSIQLGTIYTLDGQVVQTSDFATFGRGIVTVDPLNLNNVEFDSFTGITATTAPTGTITGVLRGLSFKGNNQIPANQKFHVVGTPVLIAFGTHNIIDLVSMINSTYTILNSLIENIIINQSIDASTTQIGSNRISYPPDVSIGNPTISIANPAVITVANTLTVNDEVKFTTTGTLPAAISLGVKYYVLSSGLSTSSFEISATAGGTPISTIGDTQSGTHTVTLVTPVAVSVTDPRFLEVPSWIKVATSNFSVSVPTATNTKIVDFTGLTGDTDDEYIIELELTSTGVSNSDILSLNLNEDVTANYQYTNIRLQAGGSVGPVTSSSSSSIFLLTSATSSDLGFLFGKVQIKASKTIAGLQRISLSSFTGGLGAGAAMVLETGGGMWGNTTNQITSAQIYFQQLSGSTGIVSGVATIYKINR